jgi:hypothetical protein
MAAAGMNMADMLKFKLISEMGLNAKDLSISIIIIGIIIFEFYK